MNKPDSAMIEIERWMKKLSANGGNYIRVWLSESFWDIEDKGAVNTAKKRSGELTISSKWRGKITSGSRLHWNISGVLLLKKTLNRGLQNSSIILHIGGPLDSIRQYLTSSAKEISFSLIK